MERGERESAHLHFSCTSVRWREGSLIQLIQIGAVAFSSIFWHFQKWFCPKKCTSVRWRDTSVRWSVRQSAQVWGGERGVIDPADPHWPLVLFLALFKSDFAQKNAQVWGRERGHWSSWSTLEPWGVLNSKKWPLVLSIIGTLKSDFAPKKSIRRRWKGGGHWSSWSRLEPPRWWEEGSELQKVAFDSIYFWHF